MFILRIRDAPASIGIGEQEQPVEDTVKKEDSTNIIPQKIICSAVTHPLVTLAHRSTPGACIEGSIPPIHTYWVRHANKGDFERKEATQRSPSKENMLPIVKRRKL